MLMSATMRSGIERSRRLDHLAPVLDDADQLELVGENALEPLGDDPVVVGEQYARTRHAASRNGTHATTDVP